MLRRLRRLFARHHAATPRAAEATHPPLNQDYRRPGDPEYVIRLRQPAPKGLRKKALDFVAVAGTSFNEPAVQAFVAGTDRAVLLSREPPPELPGGLTVEGSWNDETGEHRERLGWLTPEVVDHLPDNTPVGATLQTLHMPHDDGGAEITIAVWVPAKARARRTAKNDRRIGGGGTRT
jgi:hypothetical protein